MAATRESLHQLIEKLPEGALADVEETLKKYFPAPQEALDLWMIEHGWMTEAPKPDLTEPRKIERLRIPGKPVSETLIEERC